MLAGSEFSKGLLVVVVWCQGTLNGPLISFKSRMAVIERLTGCFIYDQVTQEHMRNRPQVQIWAEERGCRRD